MKLGKHFDSAEFRCRDGSDHAIDPVLIAMLDDIRERFGPVQIVSGYRSPAWNKRVGGATRSYHLRGMAADIKVSRIDEHGTRIEVGPDEVFRYIDAKWPHCGLGLYKSWVHVDCRPYRARWGLKVKATGNALSFAQPTAIRSFTLPNWAEGWIVSTKWAIVRALAEIAVRWAWKALRDWRVSPEELLDLADELMTFARQRIAEAGANTMDAQ